MTGAFFFESCQSTLIDSPMNLPKALSLYFALLVTSPVIAETSATARLTTGTAATATTTSTAAQTTGTADQTTRSVRINYDQVAPEEDATRKPLQEVTAITSDTERLQWLATASPNENYREVPATKSHDYKRLTAADADDDDDGKRFVATTDKFGNNISRQPSGPLSGKLIYSSAGHGWTNDNTSTSLWYTQRPESHGVVEDFGNLDQMNLYADLCFRAGATIIPLRPIGFQHIERVIDNDSGQAWFYGQWSDSASTASFGFTGADVPYKFTAAAAKESAVARFQPVIPVTDVYPVYCWARSGADRVNQTYRIAYAGGVMEVNVDHRRVGNGWVYLGSYLFAEGSEGYVEVTNQVRDQQSVVDKGVVVADAIRFGNGMGDVNRGGGISRSPREEESSRYWVERSIDPDYPPVYEAFTEREDQSNNVGSAPRFAAHMNRETSGGFFDRVFMSFHSNASGGRGVVGLYNSHAVMRPDHQIELAKLTADELNAELSRSGIELNKGWFVRPVRTDGHINFGEIRRDYLNNEMSATIIEVAFHDDPDDAALLRQLTIRQAVAQSAYRATVRYFTEVGQQNVPLYSPPAAPQLLSATQGYTSGTVDLEWTAAIEDPLSSSSGAIRYRLYQSEDGVTFDRGKDVGSQTRFTITKVQEKTPAYYKVTAISAGGESLPSQVFGVSRSAGPRVLLVQGASTVNNDASLTQTEPANLGAATRPGGSFVRLVPRLMNNGEQIRAAGSGVSRLNMGFDSIEADHFLDQPQMARNYAAVMVMLGRSPVAESFASTTTLTELYDYVTSGGKLLMNGACLAECDGATTDVLNRWGEFASTVLQTTFDPVTSEPHIIKSGDRDLTTITLTIGNRNVRYFDPRPNEVLVPSEKGRAVLGYGNNRGVAAVATLKDRIIQTVVIGFPVEELESREEQGVLMAQILLAMGLELQPRSKELAEELEDAKTIVTDAEVAQIDKATTTTGR